MSGPVATPPDEDSNDSRYVESTGDERRGRAVLSRRAYLASAGAAVAPAGCVALPATSDGPTVRWKFDFAASDEKREATRRALYESGGLREEITVEFVEPHIGELERQFQFQFEDRDPDSDLYLVPSRWLRTNLRGLVWPIEAVLLEETRSEIADAYAPATLQNVTDRTDGLVGLPVAVDVATMQYRRDLVEAAGYDPSGWATDPMTWQRWSQITADVREQGDVEYGCTTQLDDYVGLVCCTFNEALASWGGAYFGGRDHRGEPIGQRPVTIADRPGVDACRMLRRFLHGETFDGAFADYAGGIVPTDALEWNEEYSREPFARGEAVMHRNWPYSLDLTGRAETEVEAGTPTLGTDRLGAMLLPYAVPESEATVPGRGGTPAVLGGRRTAVVHPATDHPRAVAEVLAAAATPEFQLALLEILGWLPPRPELYETDRARSVDILGQYMDTLRVAVENAVPYPRGLGIESEQSDLIATAVNAILRREADPAERLATLADRLRAVESG